MVDHAERERFVERMGGALTDAGLPRLPSRVFAALLVDDDGRMTAAELGEAIGVSPAGDLRGGQLPGPGRACSAGSASADRAGTCTSSTTTPGTGR